MPPHVPNVISREQVAQVRQVLDSADWVDGRVTAGPRSSRTKLNLQVLFDMDSAIQQLAADAPDHPSTVQLTGVYHNLLRQWAEL